MRALALSALTLLCGCGPLQPEVEKCHVEISGAVNVSGPCRVTTFVNERDEANAWISFQFDSVQAAGQLTAVHSAQLVMGRYTSADVGPSGNGAGGVVSVGPTTLYSICAQGPGDAAVELSKAVYSPVNGQPNWEVGGSGAAHLVDCSTDPPGLTGVDVQATF
jgi:hypothetical protein